MKPKRSCANCGHPHESHLQGRYDCCGWDCITGDYDHKSGCGCKTYRERKSRAMDNSEYLEKLLAGKKSVKR
jgi:hypothetical protein